MPPRGSRAPEEEDSSVHGDRKAEGVPFLVGVAHLVSKRFDALGEKQKDTQSSARRRGYWNPDAESGARPQIARGGRGAAASDRRSGFPGERSRVMLARRDGDASFRS